MRILKVATQTRHKVFTWNYFYLFGLLLFQLLIWRKECWIEFSIRYFPQIVNRIVPNYPKFEASVWCPPKNSKIRKDLWPADFHLQICFSFFENYVVGNVHIRYIRSFYTIGDKIVTTSAVIFGLPDIGSSFTVPVWLNYATNFSK